MVDVKRVTFITSALEKKKITFSGKPNSDPDRFLLLLNEFKSSIGISDGELFCSITSALSGQALEWFRLNKSIRTFYEFSMALKRDFRVDNYQDKLLQQAYARRQGKNEPIMSFITSLRSIFVNMDPELPIS